MNTRELADAIGATYRQVHYWTACGYIKARNTSPGSGIDRDYDDDQVTVAHTISDLVRLGLFPTRAAKVAHVMHDSGIFRSGSLLLVKVVPTTGTGTP